MLKFATKKPPRLKHSEQATARAHLESHGRGFSDEGAGYMTGDFTRFEKINGDDMIDSASQKEEYEGPMQNDGIPYVVNKENIGPNVGSGLGQPNVHWKAYNVKYGKIEVEKEIEYPPSQLDRQVGFIRNGGQTLNERSGSQIQGQRSQFNPCYLDNTLENRRPYDVNRNINSDGISIVESATNYSKGSGYQYSPVEGQYDRSRSNVYRQGDNRNLQYPYYSHGKKRQFEGSYPTSPRLAHENPFPSPMLTADRNGHYGPASSLDSTASMSIDSMSTSGDRSSKSVSETMDYDLLMDMPQVTKMGLEQKPPVPHRHHHVHVGRGTHGVCEASPSPVRPGSTESQITSSLRKSPSGMKSGHHVRWGPGVVNSNQNFEGQISRPPVYIGPQVEKKGKKKTSLRSLLNLPKFPLSDDESTDHGSDVSQSDYQSQSGRKEPKGSSDTESHKRTLRKFLDYRSKKKPLMAPSQPVTTSELASLRYKKDYQIKDTPGKSSFEKGHLMKLDITQANQHLHSGFTNGYEGSYQTLGQDYDLVQQTGAIRYPIVHSGKDYSIFGKEHFSDAINKPEYTNRSPVNSVRPFLINGQTSEIQDYDNFSETESQPQKSELISVKSREKNKVNVLHQGNVSKTQLYDKNVQTTNELQTTPPFATATFDTYVTLGRPTESSVTFDTFVTHGRPFATSTPIPNGNFGKTHKLGQEIPYVSATDKSDMQKYFVHSSGMFDTHGHIDSSFTQSWTYTSPGSQQHSSVPFVTHSVQAGAREPVMHPGTSISVSERSAGLRSPYEMENREYGKLSAPPTTFITTAPGYAPQMTQSPNVSQMLNDLELLNQRSHGQKVNEQKLHSKGDNLQFKDICTYREKDSGDYDDDEVFLNLGLTSKTEERSKMVRRKLDFEGATNGPVRIFTYLHAPSEES